MLVMPEGSLCFHHEIRTCKALCSAEMAAFAFTSPSSFMRWMLQHGQEQCTAII